MNYLQKSLTTLTLVAFCIVYCSFTYGQTFVPFSQTESYSVEMTGTQAPIVMTKEEALSDMALNQQKAGFSKAFFPTLSITEMLNRDPSVTGIRFYNGLQTRGANIGSVVAIPVKADMSEVTAALENPYIESTGIVGAGTSVTRELNKNNAMARVSNVETSSDLTSFSAYFGRRTLETLLSGDNVTGINIYPSDNVFALDDPPTQLETNMTFMAEGTNEQMNASGAQGDGDYLQSPMPCPPYCGTGNEYLNTRW